MLNLGLSLGSGESVTFHLNRVSLNIDMLKKEGRPIIFSTVYNDNVLTKMLNFELDCISECSAVRSVAYY